MIPTIIKGATVTLGAPKDWDAEKNGECSGLAVRQQSYGMESAWLPTDAEKAAIASGSPVILTIWGMGHPPVSLGVEGVSG